MGQRLLDLVEKDSLKKILKSFTNATGLRAIIIDTEGSPLFGEIDNQQNCKFCQLIWQYQKGSERCQGAYVRAGKEAAKFGEPYIFRCPAGLIEWAAPIIINGEHLGSIICGQVLMWEPEDFFWIELQEMNKGLGVDFEHLKEAAKELKVESGEKVQAAADLLFVTANYIMKSGWENLQHRQELTIHQSMLAEEIENRKALEVKLNLQSINFDNSLEKERQLLSKVKIGDKEAAQKLFQELLADIFIVGAAKIPLIKARILELVVVFSRAAVEAGAEFEQTFEMNTKFINDLTMIDAIDEIAFVAHTALEQYMEAILVKNIGKNHQIINLVKRFILDNYDQNLTLEEIANSVYLSPYYLSRIFKEEQEITVMDYLTKVRIEQAKKLLRNYKHNIDDISLKLGYNDPSYFAKVFRRNTGMSPSQFRSQP